MLSVHACKRLSWMIVVAAAFATGACTDQEQQKQARDAQSIDADPIEPVNRAIYQFNYVVDGLILKPVTTLYRGVVPEKGREMVSNFLDNLYSPVTLANSVLQGDPKNSFATLWRFILNTTVGIGGVFDVASEAGLKNRTTDFGQTLAMYGAGSGPYIVLPIIGPSTGRDAIGRLADAFMNPFNYAEEPWPYVLWGATAVDQRSRNMSVIDGVYETSLDPYATFRSGYLQKRASDIKRAREARQESLKQSGIQ